MMDDHVVFSNFGRSGHRWASSSDQGKILLYFIGTVNVSMCIFLLLCSMSFPDHDAEICGFLGTVYMCYDVKLQRIFYR